ESEEMEVEDLEVENLIKNTLHSYIPQVADQFQLTQLLEQDKLVEADFWIPSDFYQFLNIPSSAEFTRGAIDLIFRHDGKFYILDWKSNSLDSYDSSYLENKMSDAGYDLQYLIYSWCFFKWAHLRIPNFERSMFGGVIYCFLRGMKSHHNEGIFFKSGFEIGNQEQILAQIYQKITLEVNL
ncbi:PD-(D/E)XK nuclease family protein, partial [bacterium]|nr:PD-(D/E)XK nuclease family protein [bacterium]